ncbi:hypothetical protein F8S13_21425 [Chloroflexia bacterium SDU3-3]|nr:hypothetical protein F8S13_21425 [Chloroflexia bacterium SDU3-3]
MRTSSSARAWAWSVATSCAPGPQANGPCANRTTYTFDPRMFYLTATDALGRKTVWSYNGNGQPTKIVYPDATTISPISDTLLRLKSPGLSINYTYDLLGRRTVMTDGTGSTGSTSYTYDAVGHLKTVTMPNKQGTIEYDYNKDGARQTLIYPSKRAVSYIYYADGQLKTVSEGQAPTPLASYTYDAVGRPDTVQRANGTQTTYGFDGADRLRTLTTTQTSTNVTLASFGYTVNALGQRTQVRETLPDHSRTIDYAYDGLGRLETADASTGTDYTYRYDVVGNRTDGGKTYNAANQVDGWTYDLKGRLTSDGTTTYGYDNLDRVIALNGVTQKYNGDGVLMQSGTITYTQDVALALPQVIQTLGTDYVYGADRLAEVSKTARTWYATDALGSVRLTTSDTGAALSSIDYDPWGQVERGAPARFGFTGELQQGSSVHLRARWYNTASGSFTSVDPYAGDPASPASLAPYMYAYNQPTGFTDPSGRTCWDPSMEVVCQFGSTIATTVNSNPLAGPAVIGVGAAAATAAAPLVAAAAVGVAAVDMAYLYTIAPEAPARRAQVARGANFLFRGGQGYVWTDNNQFSQQVPTGLPHTGNPQLPIQYEPPTGPTQRNPSMEDIVSGFPLPGLSCPDQEGFSLNGPFDWSSFRTPPMDPGPQVHGPTVLEAKMSDILDKNMQAAGILRPPGTAAHHIVAWKDKPAAISRIILQRANIDINSAYNGVYLPRSEKRGFYTVGNVWHAPIHTGIYYKAVESRLLIVAPNLNPISTGAVQQVLIDIAYEISRGVFPH